MTTDRIGALQRLLEKNPDDPRARLGLAMEYEKLSEWEEVARHLGAYLEHTEDQGNAWGRLGNALRHLGRDDEAKSAYRRGIEAAAKHGHPSMAMEFEEILEDW